MRLDVYHLPIRALTDGFENLKVVYIWLSFTMTRDGL